MAGTLKTTNYELAKYAPDDITSWLTDFNGNMDKIDAGMQANKQAAEQAQDGVDSLEGEYESLLQTVAGHTTSIDANEKAIAANTASIATLGDAVDSITVDDIILYESNTSGLTKIEPLIINLNLTGRRIGDYFSGSFACRLNNGTLRSYDRNGTIAGSNYYIHDLVRINGNPFNLKENSYTPMVGTWMYINGTEMNAGFYIAIAYIPDSNFTVVGYCNPNSNDVKFTANTLLFVSC